jgi:putative transposase
MELVNLYFFTATINEWYKLLKPDKYKDILIESLSYLVKSDKLKVYGFVIMPNHIHIIWELLKYNGKEKPHASFMKYTSHTIQADLRLYHPQVLELFRVSADSRMYNFWQRDSLAIDLYTPEVVFQKLDYIHNNPCQGKWMLVESPIRYKYSSANYYETGD